MTTPAPLKPQQLHHACDPHAFSFHTTADLPDMTEIIGQTRAINAVQFGAGIRREGYNLFVLGPEGIGKRSLVRQFLEQKSHAESNPSDWCYVNNFAEPHKPLALKLPTGKGARLRQHMEQLVDYLRTAIPALFESDEYRSKVSAIQEEFSKQQEQAFKELEEDASQHDVVLLRTSDGFGFAPTRDKEVIPPEEYEKLPDAEKNRLASAINRLQEKLTKILHHVPQWRKERGERIKQLNREIMLSMVEHLIDDIRADYRELPAVQAYLDAVQQDMAEHGDDFRKPEETPSVADMGAVLRQNFHRYEVNVLVSNGHKHGAPIIEEDNPSYSNLVGRVEHISQLGALITDFTLIKPGALHRANGGYLLLDIRRVLLQPFGWEGLKRALQSREIRIESLGQIFSLISTVSLEPEPIPLDVKIVLFGDRFLYYLLEQYDPDFAELFKVVADFEERIERTAESQMLYARMIATLCRKEKLRPLDRGAVARVVEYGARLVNDSERLSTHMRSVADLLREADYWAHEAGHTVVGASDVQQAIDTQIHRQDRLRSRLQEEILRGTLMIDTQGSVVGQINALSVLALGNFAFAMPTRITATTRLGEGDLVNIEREVKLSGAFHSKGVLILSAFLTSRYGKNRPLAFSASLAFEQSYAMIDGDSASMAELCVLLSNLAEAPIRQSLAITGSVNQFGQAQAIGAVNEKIEGFFDICVARGLTGDQGVLIPAANVKHLMLRWDVVSAVAAGQFHIYPVENVDQAITLLTGMPVGEAQAGGRYPSESINGKVAAQLDEWIDVRQDMSQPQTRKDKLRRRRGK